MSSVEILNDIFFGFWHILGEYFVAIISVAITLSILIGLWYLIIKR
jgi:hypothetical protein